MGAADRRRYRAAWGWLRKPPTAGGAGTEGLPPRCFLFCFALVGVGWFGGLVLLFEQNRPFRTRRVSESRRTARKLMEIKISISKCKAPKGK